ncbi:hypothetical protein V2J09_019819 [Rumex salicifolius]
MRLRVVVSLVVAALQLQLMNFAPSAAREINGQVAVKVGVVMGEPSEMMTWTTLRMALSDFYAAHPNYTTRLHLHRRTSLNNDILSSASADSRKESTTLLSNENTQQVFSHKKGNRELINSVFVYVVLDLIKNEQVEAIIGPETSMEAQFDTSLAEKAQVPMISYSATSPLLSLTPYFIQATQLDSTQVSAISSIVQAYRWRQVAIVYVNNEFGRGVVPALTESLRNISIHISYANAISSSSTDDQIVAELYKIKSMDTRVFIVHMGSKLGARFFSNAEKLGMMDRDYAWIVTSGIANFFNSLKPKKIEPMQGAIGVRNHYPSSPELEDFVARWKRRIVRENLDVTDPHMSVFQLWAYDAITALARAAEKVNSSSLGFEKTTASSNASITDLSTFGVSKAGPELIRAIQDTKFRGFSGDFELVDGKLRPSILEIVNVIGNGEKIIGIWTPQHGLSRGANSTSNGEQLGSVIWPGDRKDAPKGWVVSPNGNKLRILVPIKVGFSEFVKVTPTKITGYCIDIFDAAMNSLSYPVQYEYIPFRKIGDTTFTYNELISEVYYQRFDAVVGDVTIVANRSLYVDFTLPYTESGVTMVAPIKDKGNEKAWVFLKPLSRDLWVATFCFFVFIAFVVWVLEHRINPQFRGPLVHQAGTSLYYSFSMMVFAHSQHVLSNIARFVIIIWMFLVLVLTQCYTASLTSMLTIQQLQPTVTDVRELINTGKAVGYQDGSFVRELLLGLGFDKSKLRPYKSVETLDDQLTKGSEKGGVAAAFGEFPYMNLFLATYCSKYMMVPPTYKTGGFGFVFPLGSPLVDDVSRQVLKVTEGDEMVAIEKKWFGQKASCPESGSPFSSSSSLGLDSFWGLFLIAGSVATCALVTFLITFLYEHRQIWLRSDPGLTGWSRVKELTRIFDQRNMSSHTFKINEPREKGIGGSSHDNTHCPPSPSSFSDHVEITSLEYPNQSTYPSPDHSSQNQE